MKKIISSAIMLFTIIVFTGCEYEYFEPAPVAVTVDTIHFATDIQPIFTTNCATAASCHQGSAPAKGLNLEAGKTYAQITSKALVDNANPEASILYVKISSGNMKSYSTPDLTAKLLLWIKQGAKDN